MPKPGYGTTTYNVNINQQNPGELSNTPQIGISLPPSYQEGIVEDIITNETHPAYGITGANVGLAYIRIIPDDLYKDDAQLQQAMPANPFIQVYPLIGELVHIKTCANRPCYDVPLNITNKVGEQTYPNLSKFYGARPSGTERTEAAQRAFEGIEDYNTTFTVANETPRFKEIKQMNPFAKKLRSGEGDVLINGRFGSNIRLGSSLIRDPSAPVPEPNILLTAGQWETPDAVSTTLLSPYSLTFENINDDKSSIWMVANQEVDFLASTVHEDLPEPQRAHLRSSDLAPDRPQPQYTGAQIFITSDRLVLNSKRNPISLFSKSEINLSARKSITIDTEKTATIWANEDIKLKAPYGEIFIEGKTVVINSTENLSYGTNGDYTIVGKNIFIGKRDTTQPMVMGASLAVWLQDLMDAFIIEIPKSIATLNPTPFVQAIIELRKALGTGTNGIPDQLRLQLAAAADFNSRSNFVSRTNPGDGE